MSDLVKRLRIAARDRGYYNGGYYAEAADKIERLEKENSGLKMQRRSDEAADRIKKLEKEVEIRREGMRRYAPCPDHGGKAQGGCLLCRAEKAERERDEARAEVKRLTDNALGRAFRAVCAERDEARAEVDGLKKALYRLATCEADYRAKHDMLGGSDIKTGRAWDALRKAGDSARKALAATEPGEGK